MVMFLFVNHSLQCHVFVITHHKDTATVVCHQPGLTAIASASIDPKRPKSSQFQEAKSSTKKKANSTAAFNRSSIRNAAWADVTKVWFYPTAILPPTTLHADASKQ